MSPRPVPDPEPVASFEPFGPDRSRLSNRIRLHAGPQWFQVGGAWTPVADVVRLGEAGAGYRVDYGDEWVQIVPTRAEHRALADIITQEGFEEAVWTKQGRRQRYKPRRKRAAKT